MDPITGGALITGGASLAGGFFSSQGQKDTNKANLKIAREQMAFQERMSNSSYQRAMADMKLAGVNPMLVINKGGASTPGGASATMSNPSAPMGAAISSAGSAAGINRVMKSAAVDNLEATNDNLRMQNALIAEQAKAAAANARVAEAKIPEAEAYARAWSKYPDGLAMSKLTKDQDILGDFLRSLGIGPASAQSATESGVGESVRDYLNEKIDSVKRYFHDSSSSSVSPNNSKPSKTPKRPSGRLPNMPR